MANISAKIAETAAALGMDPVTLATIISYETAGTFDPTKRGPTTQWGQHRGLIQFGEPQAKQYGVDWSNRMDSQLGPDGAVAKYFRGNGWKPGMSELDAYSIVNAGAPGRYNASDANNGGAAGTVRDKVETQFGPHRQNAARVLGGEWTPSAKLDFPGVGKMENPTVSMADPGDLGFPDSDASEGQNLLDMLFGGDANSGLLAQAFQGPQSPASPPPPGILQRQLAPPSKIERRESEYPNLLMALLSSQAR